MASDYTPTNVEQGFGAETAINQNFTDIKEALDDCLQKVTALTNAMEADLDMGNYQIINLPDASDPRDPVLLTQLNSLSVVEVVQTLVYSSNITVDIDQVTIAKLTLDGNTTITIEGTPNDGQPILFLITQDGTGSRTITWDSRVRYSSELPNATLSTAANKLDYLLFRYNAVDNKLDLMAVNRGF